MDELIVPAWRLRRKDRRIFAVGLRVDEIFDTRIELAHVHLAKDLLRRWGGSLVALWSPDKTVLIVYTPHWQMRRQPPWPAEIERTQIRLSATPGSWSRPMAELGASCPQGGESA